MLKTAKDFDATNGNKKMSTAYYYLALHHWAMANGVLAKVDPIALTSTPATDFAEKLQWLSGSSAESHSV